MGGSVGGWVGLQLQARHFASAADATRSRKGWRRRRNGGREAKAGGGSMGALAVRSTLISGLHPSPHNIALLHRCGTVLFSCFYKK